MKIKLFCKQCGNSIYKYPSQISNGEGKYCSKDCYSEAMRGIDLFSNTTRGRRSRVRVEIKCSHCSKLFETVASKIGVRRYCSKKCYLKSVKNTITNIRQLRDSNSYKEWRISVYRRDSFKCQSCGSVGTNLNAHHIVPIAVDPSKIFDIVNGVTLCGSCHKITHKSYRPKSKGGELLGNLNEIISSQVLVGTREKVQRLEDESRTDSNSSTSAVHESDDIV